MNERDSEAIAGELGVLGYAIVDDEKSADVVILNSCSVRDQAELHVLGKMRHLLRSAGKRLQPKVGIVGCLAQRLGARLFDRVPELNFILGTHQLGRIGEVMERLMAGENRIVFTDGPPAPTVALHRRLLRPHQVSAYLSISTGCNMNCTYCIVPRTRGRERCRPMDDILQEARWLAENGIREITLLGQIVNQYGLRQVPFRDGKSPFVQLLERLHGVDGIERIRFTSPHPCGFREDLLSAFQRLPKLCPAVHLPMQSGSDRILRAMGRPYFVRRVVDLVGRLRRHDPKFAISTDIIVGFPGETEADFQETLAVFEELQFDMAYIFKYSPREGTVAATMADQIAEPIKEDRNRRLLEVLGRTSLARNRLHLHSIQPVLVERVAKRDSAQLVGRTPYFKKAFFTGDRRLIGSTVPLRIDEVRTTCLVGSPLDSGHVN